MRVAIVDSQVAFVRGGAEMLRSRLTEEFRAQGHDVEILQLPLAPADAQAMERVLDHAAAIDPRRWDAPPDVVIGLRFPGYLVPHPNKRIWLLHQLRQYYEYYGQTRARSNEPERLDAVRERVIAADREALTATKDVRVQSTRIGERLRESTGVDVQRMQWPPLPRTEGFYQGRHDRYVFAPSRLEDHKRHMLLVEAMAHVKSDVKAVIAGNGGAYAKLKRRIEELGLADRVLLMTHIPDSVQAAWYANSLAVFFAPHDEDYGFVTLEAMLSGKAVITCRDAGGPLMFVRHGATGIVAEPDAREIAGHIEALAADPRRARAMGAAALDHYRKLDLTWERTAASLLE